ncbi:MAG: D-alanyl-D-alanine carboxypeptidase family protein [Myxococcales bacterium]|nr:D-alanyl-D-alanine carboxypeptidase family protein [Myxococcales bacterium]
MSYLRSVVALLVVAPVAIACSAVADEGPGTLDDNLVDSDLRVTEAALANELQWVDKHHAIVGPKGDCRYVPPGLVGIDALGRRGGTAFQLRDVAQGPLAALVAAANASGANVSVLSAYRDFDTQVAAYGRWKDECVSAYPGHSEHQLGTTVDLQGVGTPDAFSCTTVGTTERWLLEHAHEHGFTVSYPKCNGAGYRPEPWHLRWVGVDVAKAIARTRTEATLPERLRSSVSTFDFFACHSRGARALAFTTGHVPDPAAPTDLLRTKSSPDGTPASTCNDAGQRFYRPVGQCLDYCPGQGSCVAHDLDAICRVFPKVAIGTPKPPSADAGPPPSTRVRVGLRGLAVERRPGVDVLARRHLPRQVRRDEPHPRDVREGLPRQRRGQRRHVPLSLALPSRVSASPSSRRRGRSRPSRACGRSM